MYDIIGQIYQRLGVDPSSEVVEEGNEYNKKKITKIKKRKLTEYISTN